MVSSIESLLLSCQACAIPDTERQLTHPALILKYSTHKNLAGLCRGRGQLDEALVHYVEVRNAG